MLKRISALLLAVVTVLSLGACEKSEREFVLTSEMSEERKEAADEVLDTFMKCVESGDAAGAHKLLSEDFGATEEELAGFFSELNNLRENPFVKYDSYYLNDVKVQETVLKVKNNSEDVNYVEIAPAEKEMYLALFASEGEKISYMLAVMLAYTAEKFEVVWVNPGDFKYKGLDAPAIYKKTKALDDSGKTIAAYINSCLLGNIVRPTGFFRYPSDVEMEDLCYKLYTQVAEKFPLPIKLEGTTNSAVYEIGIANDATHGIIPLIMYKTDVKISDNEAIRAEGERVIAAVEKLSPGMKDAFDFVRMNATNDELNENTTTVNTNSMTLELK